ncbi:hypothetical protein Ddc_11739 [Ditylenchus destructor]|nr:hypothetical protein Ddc_11739 [Ditylenchus destructor]
MLFKSSRRSAPLVPPNGPQIHKSTLIRSAPTAKGESCWVSARFARYDPDGALHFLGWRLGVSIIRHLATAIYLLLLLSTVVPSFDGKQL